MTAVPSLEGRRFATGDLVFAFHEDREGLVTGTFSGGAVAVGSFAGRRDGRDLSWGWSSLGRNGVTSVGRDDARLSVSDAGTLSLPWGSELLSELPGPRWVRTRVAHPSASLHACARFYGSVLGLEVDGPHVATPYDVLFVSLPGGAQLELTSGGAVPVPTTGDDLLVLYLPRPEDVAELRTRVQPAGASLVAADNPYWQRMGFTVLDPDGRRVVVAHLPA